MLTASIVQSSTGVFGLMEAPPKNDRCRDATSSVDVQPHRGTQFVLLGRPSAPHPPLGWDMGAMSRHRQ